MKAEPFSEFPFAVAVGWAAGFAVLCEGVSRMDRLEPSYSNSISSLYPRGLGSWVAAAVLCGLVVSVVTWPAARSSINSRYAADASVASVLSAAAIVAAWSEGFDLEDSLYEFVDDFYIGFHVPLGVATYLVSGALVRIGGTESFQFRRILGGLGAVLVVPAMAGEMVHDARWLAFLTLVFLPVGFFLVGTSWSWLRVSGLAFVSAFTVLSPPLLAVASDEGCGDCFYTYRYQSMFGIALIWLSLMPLARVSRYANSIKHDRLIGIGLFALISAIVFPIWDEARPLVGDLNTPDNWCRMAIIEAQPGSYATVTVLFNHTEGFFPRGTFDGSRDRLDWELGDTVFLRWPVGIVDEGGSPAGFTYAIEPFRYEILEGQLVFSTGVLGPIEPQPLPNGRVTTAEDRLSNPDHPGWAVYQEFSGDESDPIDPPLKFGCFGSSVRVLTD